MSAEVFDVAIFAALCGRDLNAAALRVQKFKPLIAPLRLEVSITKRAITIRPDWSAVARRQQGSMTANEPMLQQFEPGLRSRLEDLRKSHDTTRQKRCGLCSLSFCLRARPGSTR